MKLNIVPSYNNIIIAASVGRLGLSVASMSIVMKCWTEIIYARRTNQIVDDL